MVIVHLIVLASSIIIPQAKQEPTVKTNQQTSTPTRRAIVVNPVLIPLRDGRREAVVEVAAPVADEVDDADADKLAGQPSPAQSRYQHISCMLSKVPTGHPTPYCRMQV